MKSFKTIALALVTSSSLYVFAEPAGPFSVEFMLGNADQESDFEGSSPSEGDDTSWGLRFGYRVNPNLAFEAAYSNYGEAEEDYSAGGFQFTDHLESTALQLGIKGILPLSPEFSLVGRLGLSSWDYDLKISSPSFGGASASDDDSGSDLYYGIGLQYDINDQWFSTLSYTITEMEAEVFDVDTDNEVKDLTISIGAKF